MPRGRVLWRSGTPGADTTPTGWGSSRARTGVKARWAPTRSARRWCPSARCRCSPPSTSCAAITPGRVRVRRSGTRAPGRSSASSTCPVPPRPCIPTTIALVDAVARLAEVAAARGPRPHAEPAAGTSPRRCSRGWARPAHGGRHRRAGWPRWMRCRRTTGSCCPNNWDRAGCGWPTLGMCAVEPLPGGWLVRLDG